MDSKRDSNLKERMCPGEFLTNVWKEHYDEIGNNILKNLEGKEIAATVAEGMKGREIATTVAESMIAMMLWKYCRCEEFCWPNLIEMFGVVNSEMFGGVNR